MDRNTIELKGYVTDLIPLNTTDYCIQEVFGNGVSWTAKISANMKSITEVDSFIKGYAELSSETLKLRTKKSIGERSQFLLKNYYRCQHDTRYEKTRDVLSRKTENPLRRNKNTYCPMTLSVKIKKIATDYPCEIVIGHNHNHPIKNLEVLSYKPLSDSCIEEVNALFQSGCAPSAANREILQNLRKRSKNEAAFHIQKANRSVCPRRRDFNSLYTNYCRKHFGGKNGEATFSMKCAKIDEFKAAEPEVKVEYSVYNNEEESPLILAIVTPLMARVHQMVRTFRRVFPSPFLLLYTDIGYALICGWTRSKILVPKFWRGRKRPK